MNKMKEPILVDENTHTADNNDGNPRDDNDDVEEQVIADAQDNTSELFSAENNTADQKQQQHQPRPPPPPPPQSSSKCNDKGQLGEASTTNDKEKETIIRLLQGAEIDKKMSKNQIDNEQEEEEENEEQDEVEEEEEEEEDEDDEEEDNDNHENDNDNEYENFEENYYRKKAKQERNKKLKTGKINKRGRNINSQDVTYFVKWVIKNNIIGSIHNEKIYPVLVQRAAKFNTKFNEINPAGLCKNIRTKFSNDISTYLKDKYKLTEEEFKVTRRAVKRHRLK